MSKKMSLKRVSGNTATTGSSNNPKTTQFELYPVAKIKSVSIFNQSFLFIYHNVRLAVFIYFHKQTFKSRRSSRQFSLGRTQYSTVVQRLEFSFPREHLVLHQTGLVVCLKGKRPEPREREREAGTLTLFIYGVIVW